MQKNKIRSIKPLILAVTQIFRLRFCQKDEFPHYNYMRKSFWKIQTKQIRISNSPALYIASMGDNARLKSFEMSLALKKHGINASFDQVGRSLKAQMKYADKTGARFSCVLGDSELEAGKATLKNMSTGESQEIDIADVENIAKLVK